MSMHELTYYLSNLFNSKSSITRHTSLYFLLDDGRLLYTVIDLDHHMNGVKIVAWTIYMLDYFAILQILHNLLNY